jgi:Tfp pilus assembly protein PilN
MSSVFGTAPTPGAVDAAERPVEAPTEVLAPTGPPDALAPTYRVPRVDLLPPEVRARRRLRSTQRSSAAVLALLVTALAAGFALSARDAGEAADELAAVQARTAALTAQQARYDRVPQVYGQVDAAQQALRTAMAADVLWSTVLADLASSAPDGLWLTTVNASIATPATPDAVLGVVDPVTAAGTSAPVGTLKVGGTVREEGQVATWLEVLDAQAGLSGATTTGITRTAVGEQPVMTFESSAAITGEAFSRRFEQGTN